jgi:hypothetical protein
VLRAAFGQSNEGNARIAHRQRDLREPIRIGGMHDGGDGTPVDGGHDP